MINILIIDDEALIRKSLIQILKEYYSERDIACHEAYDGLNALEIIASIPIDIIITDIKMPACGGLELLKRLQTFDYMPLSVVLSGFDDYDLVRSAMKLGAADYLLKPIVKEEFLPLMDNLFSEIDNDGRQHNTSGNKSQTAVCLENQHRLNQLISGDLSYVPKVNDNTSSIIIMIELNNDELNHIDSYRALYYDRAIEYFEEYLDSEDKLILGEYQGYYLILFLDAADSDYNYIQPFLAMQGRLDHKAGVSSLFELKHLLDAIAQTTVRISNFFYNLPRIPPNLAEDYPYSSHFNLLESIALAFDVSRFTYTLHDLFLLMNQDKKPADDTKRLLTDFLYKLMQNDTRFIKIIGRYRMSENDIFICVNNARSLANLEEDFNRIFTLYLNDNDPGKMSKSSYIDISKNYIDDNYNLDITLNDVADHVGLHPNYLSTLFKKESGMTFLEYLRKVRIRKACQLMDESNLHLYEIAEKVGYHDNLQFNRAFHKETGVSPSGYRRS